MSVARTGGCPAANPPLLSRLTVTFKELKSVTNLGKPSNTRVKPTVDTKFHIDYTWWDREGRELRTYLISHLLPDQRLHFDETSANELVDFIDPDTAEVRRIDALTQALQIAAHDPQYINDRTMLIDAVFRIFLANGNKPLSPTELAERLHNRNAQTIVKTLAGREVYKGLRPVE